MPATNDANRAVAEAFDLYGREVRFYHDVAPRSAAWTPTVYHADIDGDDFVLLLEDLSAHRLGDQVEGCSLEESRAGHGVARQAPRVVLGRRRRPGARLHADVWPSYSSDALQQGCAHGWDVMVDTFGAVLPDHIRTLKERYLAAAPRLFEWMARHR